MGYPATGIEAFYRNTRSDIKWFFSLYHPMAVKVIVVVVLFLKDL